MAHKIFINIAVKDLEKNINFWRELGFEFNSKFTDSTAACLIISEQIFIMLLTEDKMKGFIEKRIADSHNETEVLLAISCDSKKDVDRIVDKAVALGASEPRKIDEHEFMYGRTFEDFDGHIWEVFWMKDA